MMDVWVGAIIGIIGFVVFVVVVLGDQHQKQLPPTVDQNPRVDQKPRIDQKPKVAFARPNNSRLIPESISTFEFSNEPSQIKVVSSEDQCLVALNSLILNMVIQGDNLLGMDCEWVAFRGDRNPVALLQLATTCGYCVLIRLSHLKYIPSWLADILSDETIKKVGVEIQRDVNYLREDYGIQCNSVIDLRDMQKVSNIQIKTPSGQLPMGVETMGRTYLGLRPYKSNTVSWSNWQADKLTIEQIEYAAMDAFVSAKLGEYFSSEYC